MFSLKCVLMISVLLLISSCGPKDPLAGLEEETTITEQFITEPPAVEPPAVEPPAVEPPAVEPPAVGNITDTIKVVSLTATENFRNATRVNFWTTIIITNSEDTRVNVGVQIFGKDAAGATIFARDKTYGIDGGKTLESTTSYGEALTIPEYDSITTWSVGEIVTY